MFKVTFIDAATTKDLTPVLFLPAVPVSGERVEIRDDREDWRPVNGVVTERKWYVFNKDPGSSYVDVLVAVDPKK